MKRRTLLGLMGAGLLAGCAGVAPKPAGGDAYVFAYFIDNGQDGLHRPAAATATTGKRWAAAAATWRRRSAKRS